MYNKVKKNLIKISIYCLMFSQISFTSAQSQGSIPINSMSIEQCYAWSKQHYPIVEQLDIIDKTTEYNISNASSGNLPQISINGQASYQSAVTALPIEMPGFDIPTIDKDQYKAYVDIYQPLTNFDVIKNQKKILENKGEIEKQKLEIDFLKLKDRINQIFFGTLLINEKNVQLQIIKSDIDSAMVRVQSGIDNGTATLTDKQLLEVEKISLDQQINENKANQLAFLKMLSNLTGKNITTETLLIRSQTKSHNSAINRPELQLFSLQNQNLDFQKKQLHNMLIPNIGLFGQGGYGRPALNFLSNEFEFYYIGGIKLVWNISALYNLNNNKKSLSLASDKIAAQRETFLLNTSLTQSQQSAEIDKYQNLIERDKQMVAIRQNIVYTTKVQLENGLITTIDYIKFINDLNKAKQTMLLHETQLLLAQQNYQNTIGH